MDETNIANGAAVETHKTPSRPRRAIATETADYSVFENACNKLSKTASGLAVYLGYSDGASSNWKAAGKIPKVVAIACEGLLRRTSIDPDKRFLVVTEFAGAVPVGTRHVDNPEVLSFRGEKFYLIPVKKE